MRDGKKRKDVAAKVFGSLYRYSVMRSWPATSRESGRDVFNGCVTLAYALVVKSNLLG